jgi:hypothetical protein
MNVNERAWVEAILKALELASLKALASPGIRAARASISLAMDSNQAPVSVSIAG